MHIVFLIEQILNGLLVGGYYLLIALGLSLIFSLGGIVNLAHGSLYALGAYVTAWAIGTFAAGAPLWVLFILLPSGAIAVALVLWALLGRGLVLLAALVFEAVPGLGLFPFWTLAVLSSEALSAAMETRIQKFRGRGS